MQTCASPPSPVDAGRLSPSAAAAPHEKHDKRRHWQPLQSRGVQPAALLALPGPRPAGLHRIVSAVGRGSYPPPLSFSSHVSCQPVRCPSRAPLSPGGARVSPSVLASSQPPAAGAGASTAPAAAAAAASPRCPPGGLALATSPPRPVAAAAASAAVAGGGLVGRCNERGGGGGGLQEGSDGGSSGGFGSSPSSLSEGGPSCLFIGPVERAEKSMLEAFYLQARDSYYSGKPLVVDAMFDQVEVHLRWLRSTVVQKYPRCSLSRHTTYSDAEEDPSQLSALYGVWSLLLAAGAGLTVGPPVYTVSALWDAFVTNSDPLLAGTSAAGGPGDMVGATLVLLSLVCSSLGVSLAQQSLSSLKALQGGEVVALHGSCPACTEAVYAFVKVSPAVAAATSGLGGPAAKASPDSGSMQARPKHKSECHVCGQRLVYHAFLRPDPVHVGKRWVYGRVYAIAHTEDLQPKSKARE